MRKFIVEVTSRATVILDEAKFNDELMKGFNACVQDFGTGVEALNLHARHIAERAVAGEYFDKGDFAEGYGIVRDAGIEVAVHNDVDVEILAQGVSA